MTTPKLAVLDRSVCWVRHCIRMKPGERCRACGHGDTAALRTVAMVVGTRVVGYGRVGRLVGTHRGMGPGAPIPLVLRHFD